MARAIRGCREMAGSMDGPGHLWMLRNGRWAIRGSMDGLDPPLAPNRTPRFPPRALPELSQVTAALVHVAGETGAVDLHSSPPLKRTQAGNAVREGSGLPLPWPFGPHAARYK